MPSALPAMVRCQFIAKNWIEAPFHEMDGAGKLSRASIVNTLSGEIEGEGTLEYLLAYPITAGRDIAFIGYERIVGQIGSHKGSLVLEHEGTFSPESGVNGRLAIVLGSGVGDFSGIAGAGSIAAKAGEHGGEYALTLDR